jgi:hypothetical protein
VYLARQPVALLCGAELGAPGEEPGPLDGDAEQVPDGIEELQLLGGEAAPVRARYVHDAELLVPRIQRNARVVAEAAGAVYQAAQAAASEHVDVRRALEVTLFVGVEAVAVAGPVHVAGVVRQGGRQVLGGGQIRLRGGSFDQPDPTSPQAQKLGDP